MVEVPIERLVDSWPEGFLRAVAEETDAAFAQAFRVATDTVDFPERKHQLGHLRHALTERALRSAATAAGLSTHVPDTVPKGSCYSVVEKNGIFLIRSNVLSHCGMPRPTRFRERWARLNEWMSPTQIDLFEPTFDPPRDMVCAMLVITAAKHGDPTVPAFVGIGVPSACLSTWLALEPLEKLIARYHTTATPKAAEPPLKDRATPKLKRRGG
ncbi:MAG: hypothetical protein AAFP17_13870 [Pseudomonadota bacterium]